MAKTYNAQITLSGEAVQRNLEALHKGTWFRGIARQYRNTFMILRFFSYQIQLITQLAEPFCATTNAFSPRRPKPSVGRRQLA
jgi:hypothetical protein